MRNFANAPFNAGGGERQPKLMEDRNKLKIRKATPKECWRLMGFTDEDFAKAEKVNSNTQLYKQAGNSIVVNVLMAIFAEMLPDTNCYRQLENGMNDAFDVCVDDFCSWAERKEE